MATRPSLVTGIVGVLMFLLSIMLPFEVWTSDYGRAVQSIGTRSIGAWGVLAVVTLAVCSFAFLMRRVRVGSWITACLSALVAIMSQPGLGDKHSEPMVGAIVMLIGAGLQVCACAFSVGEDRRSRNQKEAT
jgi:hypothetical protein